jgi:hypothetical protein
MDPDIKRIREADKLHEKVGRLKEELALAASERDELLSDNRHSHRREAARQTARADHAEQEIARLKQELEECRKTVKRVTASNAAYRDQWECDRVKREDAQIELKKVREERDRHIEAVHRFRRKENVAIDRLRSLLRRWLAGNADDIEALIEETKREVSSDEEVGG